MLFLQDIPDYGDLLPERLEALPAFEKGLFAEEQLLGLSSAAVPWPGTSS